MRLPRQPARAASRWPRCSRSALGGASPARCCSRRWSATAATRSTTSCAQRRRRSLRGPRRGDASGRGARAAASRCCAAAGRSRRSRYGDEVDRARRRRARDQPPGLPDGRRLRDGRHRRHAVALAHAQAAGAGDARLQMPQLARAGRGARGQHAPADPAARPARARADRRSPPGRFTTLAVRPLARLRAGAARVGGAEDLSTPLADERARTRCARWRARSTRCSPPRRRARRRARARGHPALRRRRRPRAAHAADRLRAKLDTLARNPDLPLESATRCCAT